MLPHWAIVFFSLLNEYWSARRSAQIQLLKLQIELLRQKLPGNRVILSPEDRSRLLRAGADMNHEINDVMCIVAVKTYRQGGSGSERRQSGQTCRASQANDAMPTGTDHPVGQCADTVAPSTDSEGYGTTVGFGRGGGQDYATKVARRFAQALLSKCCVIPESFKGCPTI